MKLVNAMFSFGMIIVGLYLLLIVGGPLFDTLGPVAISIDAGGPNAVPIEPLVSKLNFVIFKVCGLIMLAAGIFMVLMAVFYEEYQTYEY
tara:strand:- start:1117 stop:1386 length:270 start_codon:yes stop_codon:yes gene_type:complete